MIQSGFICHLLAYLSFRVYYFYVNYVITHYNISKKKMNSDFTRSFYLIVIAESPSVLRGRRTCWKSNVDGTFRSPTKQPVRAVFARDPPLTLQIDRLFFRCEVSNY